jgi:hypothetical protein
LITKRWKWCRGDRLESAPKQAPAASYKLQAES